MSLFLGLQHNNIVKLSLVDPLHHIQQKPYCSDIQQLHIRNMDWSCQFKALVSKQIHKNNIIELGCMTVNSIQTDKNEQNLTRRVK